MKKYLDGAISVALFILWLGGFFYAMDTDYDTGTRVVGAIVWLGIGVGHKLGQIVDALRARP